ncbi:MAG: tRNA pseudouridine synthase A [Bacteroidetes bacterium]|jgi:hypothetical protein|nr:tRNA pseudouridine synthase A [Bacteroidota bacterium]MBT5529243.1 tRNA pseudouridine synthase A [Cytophagia bacterium]MBT3421332.1 tRNA pseudouridine synthase A [Bacteroidota bacterium]MBT4337725.1 tRNA pseudouridine synthase A [Bacteroidota bacterium]MBT4967797.1 tRNA pseudouridine synthase A [Bacteroidota bacterium]
MQTIRLRVNDQIYKNLMWFLKRFNKEEIQIIEENEDFLSIQDYLRKELELVEKDTAEFISLEELDRDLESSIRKYDN